MPNIVIAGAQWGDEGKGKIVDLVCERFEVVARYNGGHNAGHTVLIEGKQYILHLIPSGILRPGILCVMGSGMVIDPQALESEIADLKERGVEVGQELVISDRAHLVLPHHRSLEALAEEQRGSRKIGTTRRGVGPAYEDKAGRRGVRVGDLRHPGTLPGKLEEARRHYEQIMRGAGHGPEVDWEKLIDDLAAFGERHAARFRDTSVLLHRQIQRGYSILFEGAQATMLDLDHGSYPFVTSSSAVAGGVPSGLGIAPTQVDGALGIAKAYSTRVGAGPFPSEIGGKLEEELRERGREYGATTARPRRCGWFDAVVVRAAVRINGFEALALTKLDVLDELAEIPVCTGYRVDGELLEEPPADLSILEDCEPVFETLPGWQTKTTGIREYQQLPENAKRYVERLAEIVGAEVVMVSTGPNRDETLFRRGLPVATWLEG
jgi:adenylosuccinate synthase